MQSILSYTWPSYTRVPTFVLDLDNAWINENRQHLESLDDPRDALCNLNSTLRSGPGTYQFPADLYKYLSIDNNKAGVDRPGWKNAVSRLQEILACPAALNDVERLKISIYVSDGKYGIGVKEPPKPPIQLVDLLLQALTSMPKLCRLDWNTFGNGNEEFKQAFAEANLSLPTVQQLLLAPSTEFLVQACLNATSLQSGGDICSSYFRDDATTQLIDSARSLSGLTTFSMHGDWEIKHLSALLTTNPELKTLMMYGSLEAAPTCLYGPGDVEVLANFIEILNKFPSLESLHLPSSSALGLGFDGGPWCGNAYFGPGGQALHRSVDKQDAETTERAARLVLEGLPNLRALRIGSHQAEIKRNDHGGLSASWPWSYVGVEEW